jgi:hypothetical protein
MPVPPTVPVITFMSPAYGDSMLTTAHNTLQDYVELPIGTPHPDTTKYPDYVLVKQAPFQGDEKWIVRYWSADPEIEDTYNLQSRSYDADDNTKEILVRAYLYRRKDYEPLTKLTKLTGVIAVRMTNAGTLYDSTATVAFSGGAGSGATGVPIVFRGTIVGVRITAEGTGYTSTPTVTFSASAGGGTLATGTALLQNTSAVLVREEAGRMEGDPHDGVYLKVVRTYMVLPGAWIPFSRYDQLLGPIQGRRRAVANTSQTASLTSTVKTTYEGRDGSSVVLWEIEETNSDGTGGGSNPAFPITNEDDYDEVKGAFQRASQLVVATGSEVGSLAESGGTVTYIHYEPYNQFLLRKVTETWTVPGPTITVSRYEPESGIKITESRTLKLRSAITEGQTLTGASDDARTLTTTEISRTGIGALLGIEIVTFYPAAAAYNSANAIVEEEDRAFQFPGRLNFSYAGAGLIIGEVGTPGAGIEASTAVFPAYPQAQLTKHTIRTWFVNASTKPTLTFDEIHPRSIKFSDGLTTQSFSNVLFDEFELNFSGTNRTIPATTPTFTQYFDDWIGESKIVDGSVKEIRRFRWKVTSVSVVMR